MSGPRLPDLSTEDWPDDERASAAGARPAPEGTSSPAEPIVQERAWGRRVVPIAAAAAVVVVLARRKRR
ncbi:MAG TPA: hypothetical protein VG674_08845 [Amycolatopsis sp.]|nr:hypothetical protein [Amycolatopsis sp.]